MKSPERYSGRYACVLGAGASGRAAALLLARNGCKVDLLDSAPLEELTGAIETLKGEAVRVRGSVVEAPLAGYELCVVSPGIRRDHPWLESYRWAGVEIVGELELGYHFWPGKIVALTGSNGKSSAAKLTAEILTAAGERVVIGGNYGEPLCACVARCADCDWAVVEVSSFQLEWRAQFRPEIAILLNIQADHLDRHGDMATYKELKYSIFKSQREGDLALLPVELARRPLGSGAVEVQTFGVGQGDWRYESGRIVGRGRDEIYEMRGSWFDNSVLGEAAAAVAAATARCGARREAVETGLRGFKPLPHRMELVGSFGGVTYVNDSKATSLSALRAGLRMVSAPVRLIAGGHLKELVSAAEKDLLLEKVKKVYLIGESADSLFAVWHKWVECVRYGSLESAVEAASSESKSGETVLLSPGCASFDQFTGYAERGTTFARYVMALVGKS